MRSCHGSLISTVYDYTAHTLASRAMEGVQKTWDNVNGWRCFANRDEPCGAARVSPGQNSQFAPYGLQQSLTLPVLTLSTIPSTMRTPGAALIHDWQRIAVLALDPTSVQSTTLIGSIWDRTWAYVLSPFPYRINGGPAIQDQLDLGNTGHGTFTVADWW